MILSFLAYLAARAALFFLAKEWRMLRVVAAVSIACDLARLGMMVLPSAPIVVVTDTALCILPSVMLAISCGGSSLCGLVLLASAPLAAMTVDDRTKSVVLAVVALHAYAAAAGLIAETSTIVPSWDKRACSALALCGIVAGLLSAVWADANALSVGAYSFACCLYLVHRKRGAL